MHSIAELTSEVNPRRLLHVTTPAGRVMLDVSLVEDRFLRNIHLPIHIRSILYHKEIQNALNNESLPPLDVFRNGSAMLWDFLSHLVNVDVDNQHKLKLIQAVAEVSKAIIIGMVSKSAYFAVIQKLHSLSSSSGEFREFISGVTLDKAPRTVERRRSSFFQPDDVPEEFSEDMVPGGIETCLAELRESTKGIDVLRFLLNFKTFKNHVEIYGADAALPGLFSAHLPALTAMLMSDPAAANDAAVAEANKEAVKVLAGGLELQKYSVSLDVFHFLVANKIRILPSTMAFCISLGVLYRQSTSPRPCSVVDPATPSLAPVLPSN